MFATFNMGIGMVLTVPPSAQEQVLRTADNAHVIGRVTPGAGTAFV